MNIRQAKYLLLMADTLPQAVPYFMRSVYEHCLLAGLPFPTIIVASRNPHYEMERVKWADTSKAMLTNDPNFRYLHALKIGVELAGTDCVEINPLPSFTLHGIAVNDLAADLVLPIAASMTQREECSTCRSGGMKSLTLRKLKSSGFPHYEYDTGTPFAVHASQFHKQVMGVNIPYAVETYYNNTHKITPGTDTESTALVFEQRWLYRTPTDISEDLKGKSLLVCNQNGWNRWVMEWCQDRWPEPSIYEP